MGYCRLRVCVDRRVVSGLVFACFDLIDMISFLSCSPLALDLQRTSQYRNPAQKYGKGRPLKWNQMACP